MDPRESLSELAKLITQRAVEDEFDAWLGTSAIWAPDGGAAMGLAMDGIRVVTLASGGVPESRLDVFDGGR